MREEEKYKLYGEIPREISGLRMQNCQDIVLNESKHLVKLSNLH